MILVTGGTGLVGSHLLMDLVKENQPVKAVVRSRKAIQKVRNLFEWNNLSKDLVDSKIEWIEADLLNPDDLKDYFQGIQQVYHCAAMVSFNKRDKEAMFKVNIEGTANIVNLCLEFGVEKLCHVSSTAAIGKAPKNGIRTESCHWADDGTVSNYSVSKYLSEMEVWRGVEEGLNSVIVNPSIIIGPGDWKVSSSNLFEKVGKGLKFYTSGGNAFVDVRDVSSGMIQLMHSDIKNERYLLISENLGFRSLFNSIAEALQKKKPSVEAKSWMTGLIWRIEAVKSFLFRTDPLVTKESAASALTVATYSSEKIQKDLGMDFRSIREAVKYTGDIYLKDHSS
jgi:nucleoside-diphosphate-sugar epimerase